MLRSWTYNFCWAACAVLLVGVGNLFAQTSRPSETLLPDTTQGFFAISNVDTLSEHWNKTELGHLMADPVMEPFTKDIRRQFEARWGSIHERLGLTLEDMRKVPGGDVGIGLIAPAPGKAALAIIVDVTGKLPQANELLQRIAQTQLQRGAKRSEIKIEGCPDVVIQFDLPELEEEKEANKAATGGSATGETANSDRADDKVVTGVSATAETTNGDRADEKAATGGSAVEKSATRQAFYCLSGNLLVVADDFEVIKGILGRATGDKNGSLADHKPFQAVIGRCKKDYGDATPQMRWFIHPLGYAEAIRAATPKNRRRKGKSILEVMRKQGIGAVQGVGGVADFASEGYELVHRTAVHAPKPYEKSMKMLVLPNQVDFKPEPWVPRDVATYTTFYFDILNAFDNFGALFDDLFGQGELGVWEETKLSLKEDPNGPQIDLRADLIQHLGKRISVLTDYQLPITTASERLLFAIEVTNEKAVAAAVEKLFKNDPMAKRREIQGHIIWEIVEDEMPPPAIPKITFGDVPAVTPVHLVKKKKKMWEEDEEEERKPLLPHAAVTVWQERLLVASHKDFLLKLITPTDKPETLSGDLDYQLVEEEIEKFSSKKKCFRFFSRTDEEYRPTYELIRQNKMPQSESMLARLLNVLFGEGKKGVARAQKIDGSQLPEYQVVRRYLGPAGMQVTSEPDGWFFKGFTMSKAPE